MTDRELMQMALQAIEEFCEYQAMLRPAEIRDALRDRLAQPDRQWQTLNCDDLNILYSKHGKSFSISDCIAIEQQLKEKNK